MFEKAKRWLMMLFGVAQKIVPDLSISNDYYNNYIDVWKQIYKGFYKDWHITTTRNGERQLATLQVAKLLCSEMARLIFTEKVEIALSNATLDEYVKEVMKQNGYQTNQSELIEYTFALGGGVNKIRRKDDKTVIDYKPADNFIPVSWDNNRITEGIFVNTTIKGKDMYFLVEYHKFNRKKIEGTENQYQNVATIEYRLFKQDKNASISPTIGQLEGKEVPLGELYPDLISPVIIENTEAPMFSYLKPNIGNNVDMDTPLGMSVFGNATDTLHSLDICFDSFQREFVLGRKRIIVPAHMLQTVKDPMTGETYRYFDGTQDIYEGLNIDETDAAVQDDTQVLRVEEHISAINAFLNILCVQVGVSTGFISFDATTGLKTATEVVSENSKTFRTKKDHEKFLRKNIEELVEMIITVGALHGDIAKVPYDIEIQFDDSIIEDRTAERQRDMQEATMGLLPKWKYLVKWQGMTEQEAKAAIAEMKKEIEAEVM